MQSRIEYRSLFWPLALIGAGVTWLLYQQGILSPANISVLFRLWPLLLIIIGLDLLYGRRSPRLGALIGLGAIVLFVVLMLIGPALGWAAPVEMKTAAYAEPLEGAESAQVTLGPGMGGLNVTPLRDSSSLLEADIKYVGDVKYTTEGGAARVVDLSQPGSVNLGFESLGIFLNPDQQLEWNVRLNPTVPLDLTARVGTGGVNLDLSDFAQLTRLRVDAGTGSLDVTLPAAENPYRVEVAMGTGAGTIRIEDGAAVELVANTGTGGFTIDVPDSAVVRLVASTGTGSITVPDWLARVSGADDSRFTGDSGTWESASFDGAATAITIQYQGGTGGLTIR